MEKFTSRFTFICLLILSISDLSLGQNKLNWDFGISASASKENYHRTYYGPPLGPGSIQNFKSIKSWGIAAFGERHLSNKFSLIPKIGYSTQQVPVSSLCDYCSYTGAVWLQEERHHRAFAGLDFRTYLISKYAIKAFAQAGLEGDYFLGYMEKRNNEKTFYWNAHTFKRLVPGYSASLGLQWKRLGLMAEYHGNIGKVFYRKQLIDGSNIKRESIYRHGYSVKATFVIFRGHGK